MSEQDSELRNPDNWDFDQAVVRRGIKNARAVVSVAFNREDFHRVTEAAQRSGVKTSEFIREASLDKAATLAKATDFGWRGFSLYNTVMIHGRMSSGTSTFSKPTVDIHAYVISE